MTAPVVLPPSSEAMAVAEATAASDVFAFGVVGASVLPSQQPGAVLSNAVLQTWVNQLQWLSHPHEAQTLRRCHIDLLPTDQLKAACTRFNVTLDLQALPVNLGALIVAVARSVPSSDVIKTAAAFLLDPLPATELALATLCAGQIPGDDRALRAALHDAIAAASPLAVTKAFDAIAQQAPHHPALVADVCAAAGNSNVDAASCARVVAAFGAAAIPALTQQALSASSPQASAFSCSALADLGALGAPAAPALWSALRHADSAKRTTLLVTLAAFGPSATACMIPSDRLLLRQLGTDDDAQVRAAAQALLSL